MVNSEDFGKRIQKLMDHYELSASAFADAIDTGRSSISHILSGRNKPSLDFILKIIATYPEVDMYWLLKGEGTFLMTKPEVTSQKSKTAPSVEDATSYSEKKNTKDQQDLFSEVTSNINEEQRPEYGKDETSNLNMPLKSKKIQKIVFFYQDGTFNSFNPSNY